MSETKPCPHCGKPIPVAPGWQGLMLTCPHCHKTSLASAVNEIVKEAGGMTIAESEQTCIVYGMPREAINSGSVDKIVPLGEIGDTIIGACQGKNE